MKNHKLKHTSQLQFVCKQITAGIKCEKAFKWKYQLDRHIRTMHMESSETSQKTEGWPSLTENIEPYHENSIEQSVNGLEESNDSLISTSNNAEENVKEILAEIKLKTDILMKEMVEPDKSMTNDTLNRLLQEKQKAELMVITNVLMCRKNIFENESRICKFKRDIGSYSRGINNYIQTITQFNENLKPGMLSDSKQYYIEQCEKGKANYESIINALNQQVDNCRESILKDKSKLLDVYSGDMFEDDNELQYIL